MAIRWLDAARYADTNGYQTDGERDMWRWRDWVIDAFNRNMPFDQFTIEQLAGDLLPGATLDQKIATGFNRNHRGNAEGGIIPEEYAVEYVVDRVETTATVWLGLTIGCARCHDHKFDPITQNEFYRLFAFFNNVPENGRAIKYGNSPPVHQVADAGPAGATGRDSTRSCRGSSPRPGAAAELEAAQARWEPGPAGHEPTGRCGARGPLLARRHDRGKAIARDGEPAFRRRVAVGQASRSTAEAPSTPATSATFGFLDRFTLAAWIRPDGAEGGTIVSRMPTSRRGDGYSVVLDERQGPGQPGQALARRRAPGRDRRSPSRRTAGLTSPSPTTARGRRRASKIYLDGRPEAIDVLLDELNQTFHTKEPFRIGGGRRAGGPVPRADRRRPDLRRALSSPTRSRSWPRRTRSSTIAAIPRRGGAAGQARKLRSAFLEAGPHPRFRQATAELDRARRSGSGRCSIACRRRW